MPLLEKNLFLGFSFFLFLFGDVLLQEYPSKIWHSYVFNSGAGNREGLKLINFSLTNYGSLKNIEKWHSLQDQYDVSVLGLGNNFIQLTSLKNASDPVKAGLNGMFTDVVVFQNWSFKSQRTESFAILVNCHTGSKCFLKLFQIYNGNLVYLWDRPLNRIITHLVVVNVNYEYKLLIVSQSHDSQNIVLAEIYNFSVDQALDLWLYDSFTLHDNPTTIQMSGSGENIFIFFLFPKLEMIYIYRHHNTFRGHNHFKLHQKIESKKVTSITSFCSGFDCYLAIASSNSLIYKYNSNTKFVPAVKQDLGYCRKWLALPLNTFQEDLVLLGESDDATIVLLSAGQEVKALHNFSDIVCKKDLSCMDEFRTLSLKGATTFFHDGHHYVVYTDTLGIAKLFNFSVETESLQDTVDLRLKELNELQKLLQEQLEIQGAKMSQLDEGIARIFNDGDGSKSSSWKLKHMKTNSLTLKPKPNATINSFEYGHNKNWIDDDYLIYVNLMMESPDNILSNEINEMNNMFQYLDKTETIETTTLSGFILKDVSFFGTVTVNQLELHHLNGIDVDDMLENSVMLGSNRKIGGTKKVTNIKADHILFGMLNNISASDIMFSDELLENNHLNVINGSIIFENDVHILKELDFLPENEDHLSSSLYQCLQELYFTEELLFDSVKVTGELIIQDSLNGQPLLLPIHKSPYDAFTLDNINRFRLEVVNVGKSLTVGTINGINFVEIAQKTGNACSKDCSLDKKKEYSAENLNIAYLNDIKFPEGFVTMNEEEPIMLKGEKNFSGRLIVDNLSLEDANNEIYLKDQVDGVNIYKVQDVVINGPVVTKKINSHSWKMFSDILKQGEVNARITGEKYLKNCKVSAMTLKGKINSQNVSNIMNNFSDQHIISQTLSDVTFHRLNLLGYLDGVNIESIKEFTVRLSDGGNYQSSLIFEGEEAPHFKALNVLEDLNKNITLMGKEDLYVYKDLMFGGIIAADVIINGSLTSHDKINNVNLTEFNINRVSLSLPQTIQRNLSHQNINVHSLHIMGEFNPESRSLNSMDPDMIYETLRSRSQVVESILIMGNVRTQGKISSFNLTEIVENAIGITRSSIVNRKIIFENTISMKNLRVTGRLRGIQLKRFSQDLIYDSSYVYLKGTKNFMNNITVLDKMMVGSLNGHLIQRIITKEGDHSVKGHIVVNGDVRVLGNITSHGSLNGLSITDFVKTYSTKYESFIIKGDIILETSEINYLVVEGFIKNKLLSSLMKDVVMIKGDSNITANKIIVGSVKFENNVMVDDTLNGLNITEFNNDVIFINSPKDISGTLIMGKTIIQNIVIKNDFNSTLIHGLDTNEWLEESIPLNGDSVINGRKIFTDVRCHTDIDIDYLNNYLFANTITLTKDQFVPCVVYFPRISTTSDITVGQRVNNKILNTELADTVMIDEDQEIKGTLVFLKDVVIENKASFDDLKWRNSLNVITLHTDQNVSSVLEFQDLVIANNGISHVKYISGVDIWDWNERSISRNKEQIIRGSWTINGNVTVNKDVGGKGLLNAESIQDVSKSITKVKMLISDVERRRILDYNRECKTVSNFSRMLSLQPKIFHHFEVLQVLKTSGSVESVIPFQADSNNYLMLTFFNECLSILYQWNRKSSRYFFVNRVKIGPVTKWLTLHTRGATYLITSSSGDVICEENSQRGNIWRFDDDREKYGHVFTTDGFSDIIKSNQSDSKYFTISDHGDVFEWTLEPEISKRFIINLGSGSHKFLDVDIFGELTFISDRYIRNSENKVIYTLPRSHHDKIRVVKMRGKRLTVVPYRGELVIYENLVSQKIYASFFAVEPGSVLWLKSGSEEPHLVYETQKKTIEIIHMRGAQRTIEKISIPIPSRKLMATSVRRGKGLLPINLLLVVQTRKVLLLEAHVSGNLYAGMGHHCV